MLILDRVTCFSLVAGDFAVVAIISMIKVLIIFFRNGTDVFPFRVSYLVLLKN